MITRDQENVLYGGMQEECPVYDAAAYNWKIQQREIGELKMVIDVNY